MNNPGGDIVHPRRVHISQDTYYKQSTKFTPLKIDGWISKRSSQLKSGKSFVHQTSIFGFKKSYLSLVYLFVSEGIRYLQGRTTIHDFTGFRSRWQISPRICTMAASWIARLRAGKVSRDFFSGKCLRWLERLTS